MGATSSPVTPEGKRLKQEIEREWTRLTYHYGLTFEEIARMPRVVRKLYVSALPRILAEQQLASIETTAFTKMSKQTRSSILRRLNREITGGVEHSTKPKTQEEMMMAATALGFGVKVVGKDGEEVAD